MKTKLNGKAALITGGTSGLGFATARRFASEGAYVFITGRRQAELDRLYDTIKKQKGHLDVVFANAGIGSFAPLGQITEDQYNKTFDVNFKGVLLTV